MLSRHLVKCFSAVIFLAGSALQARETIAPDILLITCDDLGAYLGCYGDPYVKTPNMDRIAEEGVLFENAWVTQASCSPSRSSIMTGLYPHQNGQVGLAHRGFSMSGDFPSIPSLLNEAGYVTGVIGKVHVKPMSSLPFHYLAELGKQSRNMNAFAERVPEFLEKVGAKPFFLNASFIDPHRPFTSQINGLPANPVTPDGIKLLPFMRGLEVVPGLLEETAGYYNGIMRTDAGVGLVMEKLKAAGRTDNLLIIVIGDHGAPFGRGKVTCYNPGLRIPFIVKWPGVSKVGAKSTALVSTIDILPTCLDAAWTTYTGEHKLPGVSLRASVTDPSHDPREFLFGEFTAHLATDYYPRRTVRNKGFQLIHNLMAGVKNPVSGIEGEAERRAVADTDMGTSQARAAVERYVNPPKFELFDLENDPENFVNLADDPQYKDVQEQLVTELRCWREGTNDPLLRSGEMKRLGEEIKSRSDGSRKENTRRQGRSEPPRP